MNLGLQGKRALVCAASQGLGFACAQALAREGAIVAITGRNAETLEQAARTLRAETGAKILTAAGDITTPEGREAALKTLPEPDILINNAGGPPPGDFRSYTPEVWHAAVNANMLSAIAMIQACIDPMIDRKFGLIINITSAAVKSPIPTLALSNAARTGLTAFCAGLARDIAQYNVTINALLPGPFNTDRLHKLAATAAQKSGRTPEEELARRAAANPTKRVGNPSEFGATCAFLCSTHASFIVGQNLLLDGGAFNSTL